MSAVCISLSSAKAVQTAGYAASRPSSDKLFTISYMNPETKKQEEELRMSFSSRYEAFLWAWDFADGRIFTVRPSREIPA